MTEFQALLMS